jgi:hypothetical protein
MTPPRHGNPAHGAFSARNKTATPCPPDSLGQAHIENQLLVVAFLAVTAMRSHHHAEEGVTLARIPFALRKSLTRLKTREIKSH